MTYATIQTRRQIELKVEITRIIALTFSGCFTGLLIAWLGINWITQCGEVTRTVDGTYLKGECVMVPWVNPDLYDHYVE
jgi:hypothetical protein|tara:strand:- start:119 stop:355 length:237 start_codon:yes stop_codon:yes gene_type:complete